MRYFQRMLRFILKYICSVLLITGTTVVAEDDDPFDVTLYGSFLHTETVPNALFFFNEIEQYDGFELRRALRNHEIDTVVLASDGGNVFEGLNMAGIIHDKGIITYVPELPDGMGCYSACSFMFFGGKIRQADGVLAVHQAGAYGSDRDNAKEKVSDTQQVTQFTVSEIIGFLNEFETPAWVYEKMFRSREFYEFNEEEKARLTARADEIEPQNLYSINGFINAFFEHLDKLESQGNKSDELKKPKVSKEEEQRILVVEIQKLLNASGCNAGIADGIWGRRTQAAAVLFAKTAKLPTSSDQLISEQFISKLKSAPANFCPKPKPIRVKSFAKYYDLYCGNKALGVVFTISEVNLSARKFNWSANNVAGYEVVTWSGSTFYPVMGIPGKLNFNKNGFVYSLTYSDQSCNNFILKAR